MTGTHQTPGAQTVRDLANLRRGLKTYEQTEFSTEPREELIGDLCDVTVVFRANGDVIFQLFPKTKKWPRDSAAARALLGDLLEVYFDSLDNLAGSDVPELKSWAVRAEGLASRLSYDKEHHVYGFARYLNQALADL